MRRIAVELHVVKSVRLQLLFNASDAPQIGQETEQSRF